MCVMHSNGSGGNLLTAGRALLVALALCGLAAPAASQTIALNVSDSARMIIAPNAKLAVPVSVDLSAAGVLNLASLQAGVTWGASQLTFDSIRVAPSSGFTLTPNPANVATGSLTFNTFSATALVASGPLFNVYFTAGATSGGTRVALAPTVAATDMALDLLNQLAIRNVDVCVATRGLWGDVTDDGTVNIVDAQQIARFSVALSAAARVNTQWVSVAPVATVAVTPVAPILLVGQKLSLSAALQDSTAASVSGCYPVTWASSDTTVAKVSSAGLVTAVAAGNATVTAVSGGQSANTTVTVSILSATSAIGASGGTVVVPGGNVTVTIPAGALAYTANVTVTETPPIDSTRLDDPNHRLSIRIGGPAGSPAVPVTVQWTLSGALPPEKDLSFLVQSTGQAATLTWPSASSTSATVVGNAGTRRLSLSAAPSIGEQIAQLGFTVGGGTYNSTVIAPVFLTTQDATNCAGAYRLSDADDGLNSSAHDVAVILVHGIQPFSRCDGLAGVPNDAVRVLLNYSDFALWNPYGSWQKLVAGIRSDPTLGTRANIYIYRYATTLTPEYSAAQLWSLINASGSGIAAGAGRILIVGHSMGGLVARYLDRQDSQIRLGGIISLGTPHFGTEVATLVAPLIGRSPGLQSLEPNVVNTAIPLPTTARLHAVRGGVACRPFNIPLLWEPLAQALLDEVCLNVNVLGDGVVPNSSALANCTPGSAPPPVLVSSCISAQTIGNDVFHTALTTDDNALATTIAKLVEYLPPLSLGTVADLGVASTTSTSATLSFTQVDDGASGAASYEVRFAPASTSFAWATATDVASGTCAVPIAGTTVGANITCTVLGLTPNTTYNFQVVAFRGTFNSSPVFGSPSNVAAGSTTAAAWSFAAPMLTARSYMVVATLGNTIYTIGGIPTGGDVNGVVQAYDVVADSWSWKNNVVPCSGGTGDCRPYVANGASVIDGRIYLPGGRNFWGDVADLWVYDQSLDHWSSAANMPTPSSFGASGVINGKMYVASYSAYPVPVPPLPVSYFQVYDPATDSWTPLPLPPHAHAAGAGGVIGSRFYLVGGYDPSTGSITTSLDIFDPSTGTWLTGATAPISRTAFAGAVVNGKLVIAGGGLASGHLLDNVDMYDPLTDSWSSLPPMPAAGAWVSLGVVGSRLYLFGFGSVYVLSVP